MMKKSRARSIALAIVALTLFAVVKAKDHTYPATSKVTSKKTWDLKTMKAGKETPVVFELTNLSSHSLNGLFYSEHLPAAIALKQKQVAVNDKPTKKVTFEQFGVGTVYPNMKTYTWVLEKPADYGKVHPVSPNGGKVVISYALTLSGKKSVEWEGHSWAGKLGAKTTPAANAVYGYGDKVKVTVSPAVLAGPQPVSPQPEIAVMANPVFAHALFRVVAGPAMGKSLQVMDAAGRTIRSLPIDPAQDGLVRWDGRNSRGIPVSSGIYFARVQTANRIMATKVEVRR